MRVLFLTKYPRSGASSRYRVYQYLPYLRQEGVQFDVSPFYSERAYGLIYRRGHLWRKVAGVLAGVLRRLRDAWRVRRYDIVFCQREALPFGPLWFERRVRACKVPLIFDYDDALYIFKPSISTPLSDKLKDPGRIPRILSKSTAVFAGNDYLRDQAANWCRDSRTVLVAEDTQRVSRRPEHSEKKQLVLGWLGSPSTEKYLQLIRRPLEQLAQHLAAKGQGMELRVIGGGRFHSRVFPVKHAPWHLESEIDELRQCDIGLMPLPDEEWSQGKSGGKARTYMAAGVPAVVSDVGFNRQLIENGRTGFLCATDEQWLQALQRLSQSAALRENIAQAARAEVERKHSLDVLAPVFLAHLRDVRNRYDGQARAAMQRTKIS